MTVFEDLIEELKDENLLETTVIDLSRADAAPGSGGHGSKVDESLDNLGFDPHDYGEVSSDIEDGEKDDDLPQIEKPASESDFFRKRAMDEVSSLQMVEHVLSGVEREHMKMSPVSYDDLMAKKALHKFLQVSGDLKSPGHAEAEFVLRQETEAWSFALFERDQRISVANIRRFCEESRPVLSSQALISLARFYRNSPFSEDVRGKFDFVMTRLFSRDTENETRSLLFPHEEMIGHINTLYANWSSIALYSSEEDQVEVSLTVTRFEEFALNVENAETFDELLETDFFGHIRIYKEQSAELFYVPEVVAAAINCNLRIGNRYLELIEKEKASHGPDQLEEKYGYAFDQIVSNAAGKTLLLVDLLRSEPEAGEFDETETVTVARPEQKPKEKVKVKAKAQFDFFSVNKWLMIIAFVCILVSVGVYFWAEKFAGEDAVAMVAKPVEIDDPDVKHYLRSLRESNETLYAITEPSFDTLNEVQQKELLQKVYRLAGARNLRKVNLLNNKGRTVAYASNQRLELIGQ
jgi:hypothetical protein